MRSKAFNLLCRFSEEFVNPDRALKVMRVYVAKVLANANATSTRNFLERFCAQNIATKDVEDIANNVVNKMKSENEKKKSKKKIQNTIMRRNFMMLTNI